MPNWCENDLIISCDDPAIFKSFVEMSGIATDTFLFNNIRPMPEKLRSISTGGICIDGVQYTHWYEKPGAEPVGITADEMEELYHEYGASNWYDWCCKYWGCKWDLQYADVCGLSYEENEARLHFETPWGPPEELYDYIRLHFPEIRMNWFYKEEGMQIAGWLGVEQ